MEMKAKSRRLKMEKHLDIVFIDYIQLMRTGGRFENRNQEMSYHLAVAQGAGQGAPNSRSSASPSSAARRKRCAASRGPSSPTSGNPAPSSRTPMSSFSSIARKCTCPDEERMQDTNLKGVAEVIVAKQRNGPTDTIKLAFQDKYARFADLEFTYAESEA